MQQASIDWVAHLLARAGSRRLALVALGASLFSASIEPALAIRRRKRDTSSVLRRKRRKAKQRGEKKRKGDSRRKGERFPKDCRRFVIAAGPDRDDKFRHIDDDLVIELIPKGKRGRNRILLEDDNGSPNGEDGDHLKVSPFTARVGDKIRIVARNAVVGGCELDEIWIHCIEGRGGKVRLTDAITPEECRADENRIGVFEDRTVRIRNK